MTPLPEPWLRGPLSGIPALLQPPAHAFVMAREDVETAVTGLGPDQPWAQPGGIASLGFHLAHLAGSTDRLMTYARGEPLSEMQRAALAKERAIAGARPALDQLLSAWNATVTVAARTPVSCRGARGSTHRAGGHDRQADSRVSAMTRPVLTRLLLGLLALFPGGSVAELAAQAPAAAEWRLAYAVDSAGRRAQGEKEALLAAVRAGQLVRVGWGVAWRLPDGTPGGVEHVATAAFLTIHHGEVFAQLAPSLGQTPSGREPVVTLRPDGNRLWYALLGTTGRLAGYFAGDSTAQITRLATYWYVQGSAGPAPRRLY